LGWRTDIQIDDTHLAVRNINGYVYSKDLSAERMEKEMDMAYIMYRCIICLERGGFWPGYRTRGPPNTKQVYRSRLHEFDDVWCNSVI